MRVNKRKKKMFFFCSQCVPNKFSRDSQKVPNVFPKMFPIFSANEVMKYAIKRLRIFFFSFVECEQGVLALFCCFMFPMSFHQIPKGFLTSPNLFPKTFPIVRYFYPLCFAQSCLAQVDQRVGTYFIFLSSKQKLLFGEPSMFPCFSFVMGQSN